MTKYYVPAMGQSNMVKTNVLLCWLLIIGFACAKEIDVSSVSSCGVQGDITAELQASVDQAGDRVTINLDVCELELYGLEIVGKNSVVITARHPVTIYLPAGKGSDANGAYQVSTHEANHDGPPITIKGCDHVSIIGPIETNGSRAEFTMPLIENTSIAPSIEISVNEPADKQTVVVDGYVNRDNGYGGVLVSNKGGIGYGCEQVQLKNLRSYNSPLNIAYVRGQHKNTLIENVYAEDPQGKSAWHPSASMRTVSVTAEVGGTNIDHAEKVTIRNVHSRYSLSGVSVQQACKSHIIEDVWIDSRGYHGDATPLNHNGGPATKIDNVFWFGPTFATIRDFRTTNTNTADGFSSAWAGQAGDQSITFENCDFDAEVKMPGVSVPNRPGNEGWSRLGVLRNSTFRSRLKLGGNWSTVENCRFIAPTLLDPVVSTSQHDDIEQSFGTGNLLEINSANTAIADCKFFGGNIMVRNTASGVRIERPRFYAGAEVRTENAFSGEATIIKPQNLKVNGQYSTASQAGTLTVLDPIGDVVDISNPNGPGGKLKVEVLESVREVQP